MKWDFHYKPGGRAVKTGISIFLCLLTGLVLQKETMFYATIAAVVCTQQTHEKTVNMGLHRMLGTLIGGAVGYVVLVGLFCLPANVMPWVQVCVVPVCCLFLIYVCNVTGRKASVSICCIVFLSIVTHVNRDIPNTWLYVCTRVLDTSIGIVFAVLVDKIPFWDDKKQ